MKSGIITFILLIFTANVVFTQNTIQSAIEKFASQTGLEHASISFLVKDLKMNTVLAQMNQNIALPTASTAKLFSTATALDILGPDYRPITRLYIEGSIDDKGVLHGNVWIRGGGDPTLGSKYFHSSIERKAFLYDWVGQLKRQGIKKIDGAVIADASEFGYEGAPGGWSWSDMGNYYGAGPSGLTIYDNLVEYYFETPKIAGSQTNIKKIVPTIPNLKFHNYVISSTRSGDNSYIFGAPYSLDRFATGTLPVGNSSFMVKGSLPDPELQFGYEFEQVLKENDILISGGYKTARQMGVFSKPSDYDKKHLLITHKGEKLIDIVMETNMRSVNLYAEHMLNLIAYELKGVGTTESGLDVLEGYWAKRFNTNGLHISDGSGLSRTNAISAYHLVELLSKMRESKYASEFKSSLPVAGVSGTLKNVCKNEAAHNRMYAKSGSMSRIKSYSGYIFSSSGKEYAFALIVNNYTCSTSELLQRMESIFNKIAVY